MLRQCAPNVTHPSFRKYGPCTRHVPVYAGRAHTALTYTGRKYGPGCTRVHGSYTGRTYGPYPRLYLGPCTRAVLTGARNTLSLFTSRERGPYLRCLRSRVLCAEPNTAIRRKHFSGSHPQAVHLQTANSRSPAVDKFGLKMAIHAPHTGFLGDGNIINDTSKSDIPGETRYRSSMSALRFLQSSRQSVPILYTGPSPPLTIAPSHGWICTPQ